MEEPEMHKRFLLALLIGSIALGGIAHAQAPKKGANGGPVVVASGHPIEFVTKDQDVTFYFLDDDGTPLATKTMQGRAVVQDAGKTVTVPLSPSEPNKLVGKLAAPLGAKARVALSATFSAGGHKHTLQARFTTD
jgi:hypothetical protein